MGTRADEYLFLTYTGAVLIGNGFGLTRPALFGSSPFMELSSFAPQRGGLRLDDLICGAGICCLG